MERKEFYYENEHIQIINPTMDQDHTISELLKTYKEDNIASLYEILNVVCIPKNDKYDFSKYTLEEFKNIISEIHMYEGLQEIFNTLAMLSNDVAARNLQYILLGLKNQKMEFLMSLITEESESLNELAREKMLDDKEETKLSDLTNVYKEKRRLRKEIESLVGEVE